MTSDEATPASGPMIRSVANAMRWLLYAAAALVFLAGVQLFILSTQTATYFAWTVVPPFTAAFLGSAYWAAVPLEVTAARSSSWAQARAAIPGIWLFTALTLAATLLHFGRFHFTATDPIPRAAAWIWLAIYTVVPILILPVLFLQTRGPGGDPGLVTVLPRSFRIALFAVGGGMMAVGVALFAAPAVVEPVWPWAITSLTAQAIGAWFLGTGLAAFLAIRENDFVRIRPMGGGFTAFAILEFVALARFQGEIAWSNPASWVYLAFVIVLLPIGLYTWFAHRNKADSGPASTTET